MHHLVSGLLFSGFLCCCLIGFTYGSLELQQFY